MLRAEAHAILLSSVQNSFQHPMVLACVVTIHKVQGISSDQEVIDVGDDILDHAHAYVAVRGSRTLELFC